MSCLLFFVLYLDMAAHNNDAGSIPLEVTAYQDTVQLVKDYVDAHPDTLVMSVCLFFFVVNAVFFVGFVVVCFVHAHCAVPVLHRFLTMRQAVLRLATSGPTNTPSTNGTWNLCSTSCTPQRPWRPCCSTTLMVRTATKQR